MKTKGKVKSLPKRSKKCIAFLKKAGLYHAYLRRAEGAADLSDGELAGYAEVAIGGKAAGGGKVNNPSGFFIFQMRHRTHDFPADYVDPLTRAKRKRDRENEA